MRVDCLVRVWCENHTLLCRGGSFRGTFRGRQAFHRSLQRLPCSPHGHQQAIEWQHVGKLQHLAPPLWHGHVQHICNRAPCIHQANLATCRCNNQQGVAENANHLLFTT